MNTRSIQSRRRVSSKTSRRLQSRRRGGSKSHRRGGSKSRRRGGSKSRRRGGSRGGSFYPYNNRPIMFTNVSNRQQGGDARDTVFPTFLTNMGRNAAYQVGQTYNAFSGNYSSTNPDPTIQKLLP